MSVPAVPLPPSTPQSRVNATAAAVAVEDHVKQALLSAATAPSSPGRDLTDAVSAAVEGLRTAGKINDQIATRLTFANAVAALSGDNVGLMKALDADANVNSIRDFASRISPKEIESMLDTSSTSTPAPIPEPAKKEVAATISRNLLTVEPTASIRRLVNDDPNLMPDPIVRRYVLAFLDHNPNWDISTTAVQKAAQVAGAMAGIPLEYQERVVQQLQKLQMANARAPAPEAVSALVSMNMLKASDFPKVSQESFVKATTGVLHPEVAAETHSNGVSSAMLYEKVLMSLLQAVRGTGLQGIDGPGALKDRFVVMSQAAQASGLNLNLETLFGSNDQCICDDCTTVYGPASYFVDLLNFLRDNDLETDPSPDPPATSSVSTSLALLPQNMATPQAPPIKGTVLEKLFWRRPDLGKIELTCENTNTILPYIDLANEVMESFVLSIDDFKHDGKAKIDVHNVGASDTTEELLTTPQNLNLDAYRVLLSAVYPATNLPYHEPVDTIRTYVGQLRLQWCDVIQAFRPEMSVGQTPAEAAMQAIILDRAVAAETLGLVQEEYIILTKEAFWPKAYFDPNNTMPVSEYQQKMGVRPVYEHYGYYSEEKMLDADEKTQNGLMFVKKQLLPRTQLDYQTLIQVIQTEFINPYYPDGKNRTILDSLRYSYNFLQTLIDPVAKGQRRYSKLVAFLLKAQILPELLEILSGDGSSSSQTNCTSNGTSGTQKKKGCYCDDDLADWIYHNFDNMGKLVVLDAGQGPELPCSGDIFGVLPDGAATDPTIKFASTGAIATLRPDGAIIDAAGIQTGQVNILGKAMQLSVASNELWVDLYKGKFTGYKIGSQTSPAGNIDSTTSVVTKGPDPDGPVKWILNPLNGGGCDITNTRLIHLNGSSLTTDEWDRFHRFLRLYKKLGYTVAETDMLVVNLPSTDPSTQTTTTQPTTSTPVVNGTTAVKTAYITMNDFAHKNDTTTAAPPPKAATADITSYLISELVSFKKLVSLTGLTVEQLLTWWGPISTAGDNSLYAQLFFRFNVLPYDENVAVFSPDSNGVYFANGPDSIQTHLPVLMAALSMTAADITALEFDKLKDKLDLNSISLLYRYRLFASVVSIDVSDVEHFVQDLQPVSGDPWASASNALTMLQAWNTLQTSGFTFEQLDYIFFDRDDVVNPIGPTEASILETAVALVDGLRAINAAHPNYDNNDPNQVVNSDMVQANAQLLYSNDVVTQIIELLEGKTFYSTNAPSGLTHILNIPAELQERLTYTDDGSTATLTLEGILKADEIIVAKAALDTPAGVPVVTVTQAQADKLTSQKKQWAEAIDRLGKQPQAFFANVLSGVFPDSAMAELLAGDLPDPNESPPSNNAATKGPASGTTINEITSATTKGITDQQMTVIKASVTVTPDPNGLDPEDKRGVFLQYFIPFLRKQLQKVFVLNTMAGVAGLTSQDVVEVLLDEVILIPNPQGGTDTALSKLMSLQDQPPPSPTTWVGYLQPPMDDTYTIYATSDKHPPPIIVNGALIYLTVQSADPSNLWSNNPVKQPIKLSASTLARFESNGNDITKMYWRTASTAKSSIPSSALIPDYIRTETTSIFDEMTKLGIIINALNLSADEVRYYNQHLSTNAVINGFGQLTQKQLTKLCAYATLRNSMPPNAPDSLITLFTWCQNNQLKDHPDAANQLPTHLKQVTGWDIPLIEAIIQGANYVEMDPAYFLDETNLVKLQLLIKVGGQIGVDMPRIFTWTTPVTVANSWTLTQVATDIVKALRSRYTTDVWQIVAQPLNDTLRQNRQAALVAYLLVQESLIKWGVTDADSLYEFFLIDVQMTSLVQTSRIKQAISTVQLYIQRILLGLEADKDVPSDSVSAVRWDWMQRWVLWEANRKVFLYPENYLDESLRDDKTPFFQQLEQSLLAQDITKDNMLDALKAYVYSLDQVANLQPLALYKTSDGKFYVFSRTYAAPYAYFWRNYDAGSGNWSPWGQMTVDVPDYKVTSTDSSTPGMNGCYLIPFEWQNRMLLFIPQIVKTTVSTKPADTFSHGTTEGPENFNDLGAQPINSKTTKDCWEISMGWAEYRGSKWLPKQLSLNSHTTNDLIDIQAFSFLPAVVPSQETKTASVVPGSNPPVFNTVITQSPETLAITVCTHTEAGQTNLSFVTQFSFNGGEMKVNGKDVADPSGSTLPSMPTNTFAELLTSTGRSVASLQGVTASTPGGIFLFPSTTVPQIPEVDFASSTTTLATIKYINATTSEPFYHKYASQLLTQLLATDDPTDVFTFLSNIPRADYTTAFGQDANGDFHEQNNPYAIYNWELGFHAPMLIADRLLKSQKYDEALKMMQYIFNPLGKGVDKDPSKAWVFPPFRLERTQTLEDYFFGLLPGHSNKLVTEWRQNPFDPFVTARARPAAFMKWAVLKYINILIEYGDYYFMQNSLETIPMAIQLYVMASHLYGPRGQQIPRQQPTKVQTYMSMRDQWDAFGNAMVQLELAFPYSNQTPLPVGIIPASQAEYMRSMLGNVFGSASTLYFAIPDNPTQTALGSKIDDRLFKIRHSQDINGNFRPLPLWDPPINPMDLVQATAKGIKLSSVLADLNGPMPNYRFNYLLSKAFDMCSQLASLGNGFLSAKEKGDGESLSLLRQKHEIATQTALMDMKKYALDEANRSLAALQYSRKSPVYKLQYYLALIGGDASVIPQVNADFQEIANQIDSPVQDSSLTLSPYESEEMDMSIASQAFLDLVGAFETLSGIFLALPTTAAHATPLGVGAAVKWGPPNIGHAIGASARALKIIGDQLSWQSANAGLKATYQKQLQDRVMQANTAGYEIKNIDNQVLMAQVRVSMAQRDIDVQQMYIGQANEVNTFLQNKYTNVQLYSWMETTTRSLYYQTYTIAYGLAKKAEMAFNMERPLDASSFIQPGYWDNSRDGLLAGDQLYLGLKNLEAAYLAKSGHDFEISKNISLRQINPIALLTLRETATCTFDLVELLFDMDFPGHYMRQLRSVAITMPCIVGPYTAVNATLQLTQHRYRTNPNASSVDDYVDKMVVGNMDSRFSTCNVPISAIAVSTAQNDAGVFELDFKGERYLPFEGAGAISSWTLTLPSVRPFDYNSLTDVIVHLKYTSVDGGSSLQGFASSWVLKVLKAAASSMADNGLAVVFDVRADFATEWYKAISAGQGTEGGAATAVNLTRLDRRLPVYTPGKEVALTEVVMLTDAAAAPDVTEIKMDPNGKEVDGKDVTFGSHSTVGGLNQFVGSAAKMSFVHWEIRANSKVLAAVKKMWLVVKYTLTTTS